MYEYEVMNKTTNERDFMWGYSWNDAVRRAKKRNPDFDESNFVVLMQEYVD